MWIDSLQKYGREGADFSEHVVLVHGNTDDCFFDDVKSGEMPIDRYLVKHLSGAFQSIYYTDPLTPAAAISDRQRKNVDEKGEDSNSPDEDRFARIAREVNQRFPNRPEYPSTFEILARVTQILETNHLSHLVIIGYIEDFCWDRMNILIIQKWRQNPRINLSKNLSVLVCYQLNQLCPELKNSDIQKIEVPLPDKEDYERYLRYRYYTEELKNDTDQR